MANNEHTHLIRVDVRYALWPGDGVFCTRVSGPIFEQPFFQLVDQDGRTHELQPLELGMPTRPPR